MTLEERLAAAFRTADQYQPSPDLFAKVTKSIEEDAAHSKRIRRIVIAVVASVSFIAAYLYLAIDRIDGALEMPFWTLEVLVTGTMIVLVLVLGPAIRRFGTAFESDVFRANAETGRSFLTLMDAAYYLIFGAYTVMSLRYAPPVDVRGAEHLLEWLTWESHRVAGLFLLMGALHAVTLVVLPFVGLVFAANTRRARRAESGQAPPANPLNDQLDRWITIVVWILVGLGLLQLLGLVLPLVAGLGS